MPSHIAHYVFARELAERAFGERARALISEFGSFLALGAQGPDIFLHNRHRRPAGLNYGIILHRKNAGRFCGALVRYRPRESIISAEGAYTLGCISHVVLDRLLHPYINYRAGWVEPKQPQTYEYRVNHPFLERIIDVALLRSQLDMTVAELDFASVISCDTPDALRILHLVRRALRAATRRGSRDLLLARRLRNAYLDAMSYYQHTNSIDFELARRELAKAEEPLPFWLGIYHPPTLPEDIDFMNTRRVMWRHPCSGEPYSSESVFDLYDRALPHGRMLFTAAAEAWAGARPCLAHSPAGAQPPPETAPERMSSPEPPPEISLERLIGNGDLSDERIEGEPCERRYFDVLPFEQALQHIRDYVFEVSG